MTTLPDKKSYTPVMKDGVNYNTLVVSPSETATSLQVVCFFDFEKNQHYEGGTFAVNEHFGGQIHHIRRSGIFRGVVLETLLIIPLKQQIPAGKLLLIGLGNPDQLTLDIIESAGYTATMEAIKLGVEDFCFAPSLKDAGLSLSFEKTDVTETLARGMQRAIINAAELAQNSLLQPVVLKNINLLAGQAQADNAYQGLKKAFDI